MTVMVSGMHAHQEGLRMLGLPGKLLVQDVQRGAALDGQAHKRQRRLEALSWQAAVSRWEHLHGKQPCSTLCGTHSDILPCGWF